MMPRLLAFALVLSASMTTPRHADGVRVGVTGAGPCAFRACAMEDALNQEFLSQAVDAVDIPDAGFNSDMHASAEYRAHLIKVLTKRAVQTLQS